MKIVPSVNSNIYTLTAIVIGYALIDDQTPAEQNSLGNWFMLIGQVLCSNSAQQQVLNNRNKSNDGTDQVINDKINNDEVINNLKGVINKMNEEINNF